ncbi:DegQ family serine endoprotease [Telmatospirillum sp. J64-1]|uniref:DegQ family serine endoprotease n=1 Tax=Telmatospirillum sp. J64-1 TaxID=2502183 RepID=UPI00115CA51A|nr:DegQ family serine endoprotease [Telmatospirillum sp. J64-1]
MRSTFLAAALLALPLAWGLPSPPALAQTNAQALPSLAPMLQRVSPGVVNISVRGRTQTQEHPLFQDPFFRRFFDLPEGEEMPRERMTQSVGSGVIIDAVNGYVVTNRHVIADADQIEIVLADRRQLTAEMVGTDPDTDIALLRVDNPEGLTSVPFGDSEQLQVGDFVVAIGNPFGIGQTATLGIVSAVGRTGLGIEGYENFIQTDASINPGNSGGALVDQQGRLVGINTAILARGGGNIGIGFAIPVNMVRYVAEQIIEHGEVRRGQLGVLIQDLTSDIAQAMGLDRTGGAVVSQVTPGSPAEQAGLQPGDVVIAIDGREVETSAQLRNMVGLMQPNTQVNLTILRDGRQQQVQAQLERQQQAQAAPPEQPSANGGRLGGVQLSEIPVDHPLHNQVRGVLVQQVAPGSRAARADLRDGDIILGIDRRPVTSPQELHAIAQQRPDRPMLLQVRRGERLMFLAIP